MSVGWSAFDIFAELDDPRPVGPPPTLDELRAQRAAIEAIVRRHRGSNVRVFGSVARGDALVDSDIDFLVDLEVGASLLDLGGMDTELRELLGRDVDVVHFHRWTTPKFRERVERDAVAL